MMLQETDIRFDRPRQMAYHVIVYFLCRLVLTASSVIGAAQHSAKCFRPGFVVARFPLVGRASTLRVPGSVLGSLIPLLRPRRCNARHPRALDSRSLSTRSSSLNRF